MIARIISFLIERTEKKMKKRFAKNITAVLTAAVIVCGMATNASATGHLQ